MSKTAGYLKAAWARRQLELAAPLLPEGAAVAVWFAGKQLAAMGPGGADLDEGAAKVRAFPLMLEGGALGQVLLRPPSGGDAVMAEAWGNFLAHGLQGVIEAQHARYSVAQETLASYREMALLQRAVSELNRSLKPAAVAASLLKEFDGRKDATDFGAVYLRNADGGGYSAIGVFGEGADAACAAFMPSRLFAAMAGHPQGDIVNDLAQSPLWAGEVAEFQSLLWLPLSVHGEHLGLLVLAARHPEGFTAADLKRAQTLVSVASSALRNAQLYAAEQVMFQSFVRVIATAIDAKSPYTAGHCRRVPEIALMLAEKAHQAEHGPFADFTLDEDERNALEIAAMLHDCGKVVTPEWVVDKSTKLDGINDRIGLVALRFEVLRRDALLERCRAMTDGESDVEPIYQERLRLLDEDFAFVEKCNLGGEFVSPEHVGRIRGIAATRWRNVRGEELPVLDENEVYNLSVQRGTLNPEERKIIEDHAVHTIKMLSQIPFPRSLRNVAEYAGGHHERVNGSGYPRGLKREQLSIPARIMAIADIFEALTAPDRPYRKAGTLNWAIEVMTRMKTDGHIDGELFDLFLAEEVHLAYAGKHLAPSQFDQADLAHQTG
ncbi:MAG: HD domain-containing phosphohydrolase [Rhodocyclaceae bacterium]|nr:HD domain-containing phosphohydrolase [Rhodocyclaceae bacterium]